jgi:hypothetical protein
MGENEEATPRTLSAYRKITDSLIERHHGRFVNSAADSVLANSPAWSRSGLGAEASIESKWPELVRMQSMSGADPTIACDLSALTPAERDRRRIVLGAVARTIIGRSELPDGFEFRFDAVRLYLAALGEWMALERRCCPFLHFRPDIEPAGKTALALTGGRGVKEFLLAQMSS